jgi:exopolyphosphatase / guanosine-5'-triphosphate,3'-diphosphate pyrophosphatase
VGGDLEERSVTTIVPRWEWRAFGRSFGAAEDALVPISPKRTEEGDEIYLVSGVRANVKVRDDLMDVKVLREVNADGLERWEPVMKQGFPLAATDASEVLEALDVTGPNLTRATYTLDGFLNELIRSNDVVRVVNVHKRRNRFTAAGCMAELADVVADGRPTRTLALESEDAAALSAAVRAIGLEGYVNTSYPRGLAALIDDEPARCAVIDVGTNSVKFHIGERDGSGRWHTILDRAEITRLGEGLHERGEIGREALERTVTAIRAMLDEAERDGAGAIAAVGTAGLRMARNGDDVLASIRERTGIGVEVISGEVEGRLAYLAARAGLDLGEGSLVVFDTGGGSTQFTFGHGSQVDERFSVGVGAVRFTERFGLADAVTPEVLSEALAAIADDLGRLDGRPPPDGLVGMGGAVTNIAAVHHRLTTYDPDVVQGTVLDRAEIARQIELYRSRGADARRAIAGLQPKRSDVILAGACIVATVMDKLGRQELTVSDRGLRHGLLVDRFGP